ncbi:hypothetical protein [Streptomyces sp. PT12]|uniref:hypothetical protein n=1 Tax=Streptomyces sp. PT12 TaxID=1510197 RepID=UPI000DE4CCE3|nr:hypothetical protein [Streptomyces sp. PT12]RBM17920.1 hypothetical protein DEH69_13985 [Streptomyces sp. PT12]
MSTATVHTATGAPSRHLLGDALRAIHAVRVVAGAVFDVVILGRAETGSDALRTRQASPASSSPASMIR